MPNVFGFLLQQCHQFLSGQLFLPGVLRQLVQMLAIAMGDVGTPDVIGICRLVRDDVL